MDERRRMSPRAAILEHGKVLNFNFEKCLQFLSIRVTFRRNLDAVKVPLDSETQDEANETNGEGLRPPEVAQLAIQTRDEPLPDPFDGRH